MGQMSRGKISSVEQCGKNCPLYGTRLTSQLDSVPEELDPVPDAGLAVELEDDDEDDDDEDDPDASVPDPALPSCSSALLSLVVESN